MGRCNVCQTTCFVPPKFYLEKSLHNPLNYQYWTTSPLQLQNQIFNPYKLYKTVEMIPQGGFTWWYCQVACHPSLFLQTWNVGPPVSVVFNFFSFSVLLSVASFDRMEASFFPRSDPASLPHFTPQLLPRSTHPPPAPVKELLCHSLQWRYYGQGLLTA